MQGSDVSEHNMECFWWVRPGKQGSRGPRSVSQNCPHLSTSKILYIHNIVSTSGTICGVFSKNSPEFILMENVISMFQVDDSFTVGTFSPWTSQHLWTENVGEGWSVSWDKSYNCRTRHTCECLGNDQKSREQEIAHPFKPRGSPIIQNINPTTRF